MSNEKPNYNEIIFSKQDEEHIIDLYSNKNISTVKIGQMFDCSHKVIAKVLKNIQNKNKKSRNFFLDFLKLLSVFNFVPLMNNHLFVLKKPFIHLFSCFKVCWNNVSMEKKFH